MSGTRGSGLRRRTWRRPCSWTGRTSRSSTSSWAATRATCGWACGSGRCGTSRGASATSRRPGSRTRRTRPMRGTFDRRRRRGFRAVAVRHPRGRHHERGGDAGADLRGGVRRHRADQGRHRVLVLRVVGLPGRAGVLLRVGGRRDRGGPADHGVARGDGRRVGAVRGLGEDPHRRGGDRAGLRVRQVVGRGTAARAGLAARPVPARPAVAGLGLGRGPAGAPRPGGWAVDREGHGGGGRAQPGGGARQPAGPGVRAGRGRRPAGTTLCGRTAAGARLRPGRRRGRGGDHRVRRAGPGSLRAARLDHRVRAPDRLRIAGRAGPAGGAIGDGRGPGGGSRRGRRGGVRPGRGRRGPGRSSPGQSSRVARAVQPPGDLAARGAGARRRGGRQPLGRRAVREPGVRRRAGADRDGGAGGHVRRRGPRAGPRDQRSRAATEPGVRRGGPMKQLAAVLGVGQTRHRSKRTDVSIAGLCREAADRALQEAGLTLADIDAVVVGKAPDLFEGVMMPELYLADALGAVGKPLLRVHTAGSVGGATGIVATSLVQAGLHRRVLAVAFEKQSESNAMWALSIAPPFSLPVVAGAGGYFAPHIRAYIRRSGAPPHIGAMVAVKDRRNGALNPYAHLQQPDITLESVRASPMLWDPVRYDETCPSSDGACAVIIGDSDAAEASPAPVAWIRATAMRSEPTMFAGKDHVNPRAGAEAATELWRRADVTEPLEEIDVAEIYVPFSWYEPMWLENLGFAAPGEGWRLTEAGETALGGRLPVNPSGGVLSSNPIGASGLLRFAEAALQVMGKAGAHQVPGARTALGHAYGGGSQFFSMWVVSDTPR